MPSGKTGDAEVRGRVCGCFTSKPRLAAHSIIVAALFIFGACNAAAASSSSALPPTSAAAAALVAPSPQGNQNRGGGRRGSGVGERGWEREGAELHRERDEWVREDGVGAVGGSVQEHDWGWATDGDLMERLTRFEAKVDALARSGPRARCAGCFRRLCGAVPAATATRRRACRDAHGAGGCR